MPDLDHAAMAADQVRRLAVARPEKLAAITVANLGVLARALGVSAQGPKAALIERIVTRADVLTRIGRLPQDPVVLARTMKRESLVLLAKSLGGFTGVNKYGLAASVIGRRAQILMAMGAQLAEEMAA